MNVDQIRPFKAIRISGEPYERGHRYGAECRDLIRRLVDSHYYFYDRHLHLSKDAILKEAKKFVPFIEDYSPEIMDEVRGTAEGAELRSEEVVMVLAFPELYYPRIFGTCTAFAVADRATSDGETYVGQNEDEALDPWLSGECSVLISVKRKAGPDLLTYTYAGIPAMKGVNSEGIGLCINALICEESEVGVPCLVVTREILHQKTIGDALGSVIRAKRANSLNYVIADKNGEIYDIEATPSDIEYYYSDEYIVHSNHFLSTKLKLRIKKDFIIESLPDTIIRYNRMSKLLNERVGKIDVKMLMQLLRDHVNYPDSICRHVDETDDPAHRSKTLDSIILVPSKKEAWFTKGNPCETKFVNYTIEGSIKAHERDLSASGNS